MKIESRSTDTGLLAATILFATGTVALVLFIYLRRNYMLDPIESLSIEIAPRDSRCRHWTKVIRADRPLPVPSAVAGADSIPGPYARDGLDELLPGDIIIDGEANHHRRFDRGWTYQVRALTPSGRDTGWVVPSGEIKAALKAAGLPVPLLPGSGEVAACVRIAHAIRLGLFPISKETI